MKRRDFLAAAAGSAGMASQATGAPRQAPETGIEFRRLPIRKGVEYDMLPSGLTPSGRFRLAKACGFESVEVGTTPDPALAAEIGRASKDSGVPIHSVMNKAHWENPLSSPKPEVVARGVQGMETSIGNAKLWGAKTVLLVPAVVTPEVSYQQAWERSQQEIRKLLPLAEKSGVIIAIEEVWNKFLLSPLEFARYVDDFQSPWVRAYFDVGNVVLYGFPQDWIRTLGSRIVKLHLKDFSFKRNASLGKSVADWVNLGDGQIDWKAVYHALSDIGYQGDATVELAGGDELYLKDVSRRVEAILRNA